MKQRPTDDIPSAGEDEISLPSQTPKRRPRARYWLGAFFVALLLHLILLPVLLYEMNSSDSLPKQAPFKVRFNPSQKQLAQKLDQPITNNVLPKNKQLVDIAKPQEEKKPEKADYLSEYDSSVKEQTKSNQASPNAPNITETPQQGKQSKMPEQGSSKPSKKPGTKAPKSETLAKPLEPGKRGQVPSLMPNMQPDGEEGEREENPLVPSLTELGKYAGTPFSDHLQDVEEDAATRLNTLQWRYASFFNRIKERVGREWDPRTPIRRYDPQGTKIGNQERLTVVKATIDKEGNVIQVMVHQPSGVYYLDDEALRAFRESGPFPNPPIALFDGKSTFTFDFGFYLSNEGRGGIDFNWKPY